MKAYVVYILRCSDGTLYTGITNDIAHRLRVHNEGKGAKYTKTRRPVQLISFRRVASKSQALKLEHFVKKQPASRKIFALYESIPS